MNNDDNNDMSEYKGPTPAIEDQEQADKKVETELVKVQFVESRLAKCRSAGSLNKTLFDRYT